MTLRRLGTHIAPDGLYLQNEELPFAGVLRSNVDCAEAGSWQEILLDFEVGKGGMADGATFKITFKFYSDWAPFQTIDPAAADYVSAEYRPAPRVNGQSEATVQHLTCRFDQKGHERPFQKAIIVDVVDGYLNAGDHILIRLGDRRGGGPGTRIQSFVEDGFKFRAYVDVLGTSRFLAVPGDAQIRIHAGPPTRLVLNGSRAVRRGASASFQLSLQDRWGNAVSDFGKDVRLTIEEARGVSTVRTIALPKEGWACATLCDLPTHDGDLRLVAEVLDQPSIERAEAFLSMIDDLPIGHLFYGDLHVHAHDTVGTNSPTYNAAFARDIGGADFFGYTANDFQITDEAWLSALHAINALNEPGRFLTYPVQEWCGSSTAGGDHKVIFLGEQPPAFPYNDKGESNRTLIWNEDMKGTGAELGRWPIEELWSAYIDEPENHLVIPHVGGRRYIPDWHHPSLERLVEITSTWGHFPWLYQDVISRGYKLGACANSDEHRGRPAGGAPGVQVFGVRGGMTGVFAETLDRASVGRALRARHTFATTGERSAVIVRCGDRLQGDEFSHNGPADISYRFLGDSGFDEIAAYDHGGLMWRRNLHEELGYSKSRVRFRWGGARIKDRYRWATWRGRIRILNSTIHDFTTGGFEHVEETAWQASATDLEFFSETYGDSDTIEIDLSDLEDARFVIEGTIGGFTKVGDVRKPTPFAQRPEFSWAVTGADLVEHGSVRLELGGVELFVALERMTEAALPTDFSGRFTVDASNAPFGFRPVYLFGRQRGDAKIWSSALFIVFADGPEDRAS